MTGSFLAGATLGDQTFSERQSSPSGSLTRGREPGGRGACGQTAPRPPGSRPRVKLPDGEDCLSLNVWSPNVAPAKKLPVMVWIYGGGFREGGSAAPLYDLSLIHISEPTRQ